MNLKTIQIEFTPPEIQRILSIALDEDKEGALEFIRQTLAKRVEKALTPH
jgi:hypothetical protein